MPVAEPNPSTLQEVSSSAYPSLERKPGKQNWVDKAGGLPSYIERIAKHLHYEKGKSISTAIAMAVNTVKRWSTGTNHNGGKLKPDTVAKAQAAVAQWEKAKAKSKLKEAIDESLEMSADDRASVIGGLMNRLTAAQGIQGGLRGEQTFNRAGSVATAKSLLEGGRELKMVTGGGRADRPRPVGQGMRVFEHDGHRQFPRRRGRIW